MPKTQLIMTLQSFYLRRWPSSDRPCNVRLAQSSEFQNPSFFLKRNISAEAQKQKTDNLAQTPNTEERNKTKSSWLLFTNLQNWEIFCTSKKSQWTKEISTTDFNWKFTMKFICEQKWAQKIKKKRKKKRGIRESNYTKTSFMLLRGKKGETKEEDETDIEAV